MTTEIADRFKEAFIKSGMTYERLAELMGVSPAAAHKWGKTGKISRENAIKLSRILNVPIAWLLAQDSEVDREWEEMSARYMAMNEEEREAFREAMQSVFRLINGRHK